MDARSEELLSSGGMIATQAEIPQGACGLDSALDLVDQMIGYTCYHLETQARLYLYSCEFNSEEAQLEFANLCPEVSFR